MPSDLWEWEQTGFSLHAKFLLEPDIAIIEKIVRSTLSLSSSTACDISWFNEGSCNKVYRVTLESSILVMRVGIPIEAPFKVMSEVSVSLHVARNVSILIFTR
jgi:hypothetical protein